MIQFYIIDPGVSFAAFRVHFRSPTNIMKTLLLLRHAKSSWKETGVPDHERPLNKRGKKDAPRVGLTLRDQELLPDLILCSSARRARDTAEVVSKTSGYQGEIQYQPTFYLAEQAAYYKHLSHLPEAVQRPLVVGHNPDLEELVQSLTGEAVTLPTAALVRIELPVNTWAELNPLTRGRLVQVWRPREAG